MLLLEVQPTKEMRACGIPQVGDSRKLEGETRRRYRTIYQMIRTHGLVEGHTCRECRYLTHKTGDFAGRFLKCLEYESTRWDGKHPWSLGSSATDWRARWPACGKFEAKGD